jgi:hypothetical protein
MTRASVQAPLVFLDPAGMAPSTGAPAPAPTATPPAGACPPWDGAVLATIRRAWSGGMREHFARRGLPLTEQMMVDALIAAEAVPSRAPSVDRTSGGTDAAR